MAPVFEVRRVSDRSLSLKVRFRSSRGSFATPYDDSDRHGVRLGNVVVGADFQGRWRAGAWSPLQELIERAQEPLVVSNGDSRSEAGGQLGLARSHQR